MAALRNLRALGMVVAITALALTGGCASEPPAQGPAAPSIAVQVRFTSLWWSKAQMEGLNPNAPPPKNTEVELTRWEYTDPIGVPHPDVVNAVVTLENRGTQRVADLIVKTDGDWKTGPRATEASASWGEGVVLAKTDHVEVPAGSTHSIRVPIDVKRMMDTLERQKKWPYALRVSVSVEQPGAKEPLARAQVEFPIRPGD